MSYQDSITVSINNALRTKLCREARGVSKAESKLQHSNAAHVKKRRYAEDMALAKELGVTIEELTE
jgi:hypothetical protein